MKRLFQPALLFTSFCMIFIFTSSLSYGHYTTYISNGTTHRLIQIPNKYVVGVSAGKDSASTKINALQSINNLELQMQNLSDSHYIGGGLIVITTDDSNAPQTKKNSLQSIDQTQFIYPVYRRPGPNS